MEILREKGKDLLFLKVTKYKEASVRIWISGAAVAAAAIGAIPLPGADIIPLTALQVSLCLKIAYIYNCKVTKSDVMSLIGSTVTGLAGKSLFRNAIKLAGDLLGPLGVVPSSIIAATIAGSMTWGLGWAANAYYKSGMTIDLGEVGEIYQNMYKAGGWQDTKPKGNAPSVAS
jgi:GTP-binding protein Era